MSPSDQHEHRGWRVDQQIRRALRPVLIAGVAVTLLRLLSNIALAMGAMLMLDVALPGRNGETIVGLLVMAIGTIAMAVGGGILRERLARQAGFMISFRAVPVTVAHRYDPTAKGVPSTADGNDMDLVRNALTGGIPALADLTMLPIYVAVILLLGWPMALALFLGGIIGIAALWFARTPLRRQLVAAEQARAARDDQLRINSTAYRLTRQLGMTAAMRAREAFAELSALEPMEQVDRLLARGKWTVAALVAVTLAVIVALTVWRATDDRAGVGTIVAALLMSCFALAPLLIVASRQVELLRAARAWRRLSETLGAPPPQEDMLPLPAPREALHVEGLAIRAAGERRVVLQGGTFDMTAGDIAVVVGPSDTGKSMLLKALAGLVPDAIGSVRLDGATLAQYGETGRARHIGYMSQSCELLPGTISQIIAGFSDSIDPEAVVRAAQLTGAHDTIVRLPQGYDTMAGGPDCTLPQSVRQRICLTRAFFGDPFLVLLDSPDSFQDRFGRAALGEALQSVRTRGGIALVVGDSAAVIDAANLAMVLQKGGIADFGPKDEVRQRMQTREQIKNEAKPPVASATASE